MSRLPRSWWTKKAADILERVLCEELTYDAAAIEATRRAPKGVKITPAAVLTAAYRHRTNLRRPRPSGPAAWAPPAAVPANVGGVTIDELVEFAGRVLGDVVRNRISALEAENEALRNKISALEADQSAASARLTERAMEVAGVRSGE